MQYKKPDLRRRELMSDCYSNINPCHMCMPMGSVLAFRGLERCMPIFHGSQGCSTYMRLYLAHHFREPIDIASSALSEKGAVYGGAAHLKKGLKNVIHGYNPKAIGVATTCLAETIGDDVSQIIREFRQEEPSSRDLPIIYVSTPSYSGSHEEGYADALLAIVQQMAADVPPRRKLNGRRLNGRRSNNSSLNLILGTVISPADVRYLKSMLRTWGLGLDVTILPDISETFGAPLSLGFPRMAEGGTPLADVARMGISSQTITLGGRFQESSAGVYLEETFGMPNIALPLPIGLENTDRFVFEVERLTGMALPREFEIERGRLLDTMVDVHKYLAETRAAIFGDTEIAVGLAKLLCEVGAVPAIVATGSRSPGFAEAVRSISPRSTAIGGADFSDIQTDVKKSEIDILIGTSNGRKISKAEKIPLVRIGLPNSDRVGAGRQLTIGYEGAGRLLDTLANTLLEKESRR